MEESLGACNDNNKGRLIWADRTQGACGLSVILTIVVACVCLWSCSPETHLEVSYQAPVIPIVLSVNSEGDVKVSLRGKLVTPIGVFSLSASVPVSGSHHQVIVEHIPRAKKTVYELRGQLKYVQLDKDDGVSVTVSSTSTTIRLHQNKIYSVKCIFDNRSDNVKPIPYREPDYDERYHIFGTNYFYDFAVFKWTSAVSRWSWFPVNTTIIDRSDHEIIDWLSVAGRWTLNVLWWLVKLLLLILVPLVEVLLIPLGLVFYTGWRGITVVAGVVGVGIELVVLFWLLAES